MRRNPASNPHNRHKRQPLREFAALRCRQNLTSGASLADLFLWPGQESTPFVPGDMRPSYKKRALRMLTVATMPSETGCLASQASTALKNNPFLPKRTWRIEAHEGQLTLHGRVSSWYQKQMAQETLLQIDGVERVENQLEVYWA